jgi:hypothetical protein
VMEYRNGKARIRVPGNVRSQWIPVSELMEDA